MDNEERERLMQLDEEIEGLRARLDDIEFYPEEPRRKLERAQLEVHLEDAERERDELFDALHPAAAGPTVSIEDLLRRAGIEPPVAPAPKPRRVRVSRPVSAEGMSTSAAAAFLGVSPRTLEAWRMRGEGPAYAKLGTRVLYREDDLTEYRDRGRIEPEG